MTPRFPASPTSNFPGTLAESIVSLGLRIMQLEGSQLPMSTAVSSFVVSGFRDENCSILRYVDLLNLGKCPLKRRSPSDLAPFLLPRHRSARHRN